MLELPSLETVTMQIFLDHFSRRDPESWHIILMDNASAHTTGQLKVPENIVIVYLPACAPELNPIERFWKELKDWLSDYEVPTMKEMSELISEGLKSFTKQAISSITSFEYLMKAWEAANA